MNELIKNCGLEPKDSTILFHVFREEGLKK